MGCGVDWADFTWVETIRLFSQLIKVTFLDTYCYSR